MTRLTLKFMLTAAVSLSALTSAYAAEPESCGTVRFADVGWTDITATTATVSSILKGLGYQTRYQGSRPFRSPTNR